MAGRNLFATEQPQRGRDLFAVVEDRQEPSQEVVTPIVKEEPRLATFDPFAAAFGEPQATERETAVKSIKAIPSSAVEFGKAMITPIIEPIQTAKSIKSLVVGLYQKITPGIQPDESTVDAVGNMFKERYGSIEGIQKTIETDPVGLVADISTILTAGGTVAARALPAAGKLAKIAKDIARVGKAIEPLKVVRLSANNIKKLAPKQFAERMYESSIKLKTTMKPAARTRAVKAGLEEGIVPTKGGLLKIERLLSKYGDKVDDIIDQGMVRGGKGAATIKTESVLRRLDEIKEYFGNSFLGDEYLDDINAVADKFKNKFGDTITVKQAQDIKRNTQQILRKSFGEMKSAKLEAGKNIARGIREELENVFPEIGTLNEKSRSLIELNKELERAVGRISNRNLMGLTSKIFTASGVSSQTPGVGLMLALTETVLGNPRVKTRMAIALKRAGAKVTSKGITDRFRAGAARQVLFQTGRLKEETQALKEGEK